MAIAARATARRAPVLVASALIIHTWKRYPLMSTDANHQTTIEPSTSMCPYCKKRPLWSHHEREDRICNRCVDAQCEREQSRREWSYYHHG